MLKLLALFAILSISFAGSNWVGTWNVTSFFGNWDCPGASPQGTLTITALSSTSLRIRDSTSEIVWDLPWGQFNTTGDNCHQYVSEDNCIEGDLERGQITWYCAYKPRQDLYHFQGINIVRASSAGSQEKGFLSESEEFLF